MDFPLCFSSEQISKDISEAGSGCTGQGRKPSRALGRKWLRQSFSLPEEVEVRQDFGKMLLNYSDQKFQLTSEEAQMVSSNKKVRGRED